MEPWERATSDLELKTDTQITNYLFSTVYDYLGVYNSLADWVPLWVPVLFQGSRRARRVFGGRPGSALDDAAGAGLPVGLVAHDRARGDLLGLNDGRLFVRLLGHRGVSVFR